MAKLKGSIQRARRRIRRRQNQVEDFGQQTEQQLDQNFFGRLHKFTEIWRFITTWIALFVLLFAILVVQNQMLAHQYQTVGPVPGGLYSEGLVGSFTNANPIYATSDADLTVSRLVFAGLLRYDNHNNLVGDLAESWSVDDRGTTYTFKLRPNLKWHDGEKLTADDVMFTYQTIQNADAQSPYYASWRNITVAATDSRTVTFKLANPLVSFAYNLTNGIVPKHVLGNIALSDLRSSNFNTANPIGAGPFAWDALEVNGTTPATAEIRVALKPFSGYWNGAPKLRSFVIRAYPSEDAMITAYKRRDLTAMAGLTTVPKDVEKISDTQVHNIRLNAATMVFFKTSVPVLSDVRVRQALIKSVDQKAVLGLLDYPTRPVKSPFLQGQVGYDASVIQPDYNLDQAKADLAAAGWIAGKNGILTKDNQRLEFNLFADENAEYATVARYLSKEWRKVGVDARVNLMPSEDFREVLADHNYDAVLHGISIGTDPDVFAYWDSSQTDVRSANRLNFSEYKSAAADAALQAGRSTTDPVLRSIKYKTFLANWQKDAPALGLYQPRYLYITHGSVYGLNDTSINIGIDHLANVNDWMIRTAGITN